MGIEPTQPAWKAGILAIELHPHIVLTHQKLVTLTIIAEYVLFVNTFFYFFLITASVYRSYYKKITFISDYSPLLKFYSRQIKERLRRFF